MANSTNQYYSKGINGEVLCEACYSGDIDFVNKLLSLGVEVNSPNKVNKWTALHWAAKSNHLEIVKLLLDKGAKKELKNDKENIPFDLAQSEEIKTLLMTTNCNNVGSVCTNESQVTQDTLVESLGHCDKTTSLQSSKEEEMIEKHGFVPSFIKHPQFFYANKSLFNSVDISYNSSTHNSIKRPLIPEICIKVRISGLKDLDFIEIDINTMVCNFDEFKGILCEELDIIGKENKITKIRKLPNIKLRNVKDICRLKDGDSIEIILA